MSHEAIYRTLFVQTRGALKKELLEHLRRAIRRQRTIVARLSREVTLKASSIGAAVREALGHTLDKATRIVTQSSQRKAIDGRSKLYAWHAP